MPLNPAEAAAWILVDSEWFAVARPRERDAIAGQRCSVMIMGLSWKLELEVADALGVQGCQGLEAEWDL